MAIKPKKSVNMFSFKDETGRLKTKKIFIVSASIVVLVCILYFVVLYCFFPVGMEKRGQLGDMFGFIGALFSGLAFAGLIVTMLQQREDLQNQKDEIQLQRKDLEAQTAALQLQKEEIAQTNKELKEQNKTIMLQRFENTFFNMLDFQMKIYGQVKCTTSVEPKKGDDAFVYFFNILRDKIRTNEINIENVYYGELDHYNRHLSQILNLVDGAYFLTMEEKNKYVGILASHMSYYELVMFFYYGISPDGKKRAKDLVEKYALFRDFGKNTVFAPEHITLYSDGAYGVRNDQ